MVPACLMVATGHGPGSATGCEAARRQPAKTRQGNSD